MSNEKPEGLNVLTDVAALERKAFAAVKKAERDPSALTDDDLLDIGKFYGTDEALRAARARRAALPPKSGEEELTDIIVSGIKVAVAPIWERLRATEQRVAVLEAREYQGVWDATRAYAKGAMVTRDGSIWCSNVNENRATPGQHPHWTLAVKRGRDSR